MGIDEKYGKRIQITFRITPVTMDRLERAAPLLRMNNDDCHYTVPQHCSAFAKEIRHILQGGYSSKFDCNLKEVEQPKSACSTTSSS